MNYGRVFAIASILILMVACMNAGEKESLKDSSYTGHKVTVVEAISGKTYSYLLVSEKGNEHWIAVRKVEVKVGDTLYYSSEMEMRDFKSKELNKTFESIGFVSRISNQPNQTSGAMMHAANTQSGSPEIPKTDLSIKVADGGITIAELYSNRDSYNRKSVIIRGKVVKFNSQIMGRNWAHIQDGSGDNGNYDLTITTKEDLKVGDVVTLKGIIATSKDFGAGYSYDIIMESATTISK
jgi:hypothetical protein